MYEYMSNGSLKDHLHCMFLHSFNLLLYSLILSLNRFSKGFLGVFGIRLYYLVRRKRFLPLLDTGLTFLILHDKYACLNAIGGRLHGLLLSHVIFDVHHLFIEFIFAQPPEKLH